MYQQVPFANLEYYHCLNRGVEKRTIFLDKKDYERFYQTLEYYRFKNPPTRFSFRTYTPLKKTSPSPELLVDIIAFCLMPNHFHLLLKQVGTNGTSVFLSKVTNSYTKYFNIKYKRVGPLFQGPFKAVPVKSDTQLLHLSRYIHLNPVIGYLTKNPGRYQFSSYPEYLGTINGFCNPKDILGFFSSPADYHKFVLDHIDYGRTLKNVEKSLLE